MIWRYGGGLLLVATTAGVIALVGLGLFGGKPDRAAELSLAMAGCVIPDNASVQDARIFDARVDADALSQAEQFVCHSVEYPRELGAWQFTGVDALRVQPAGLPPFWLLNLRYTLGVYGTGSARYIAMQVSQAQSAAASQLAAQLERANLSLQPIKTERLSVRGRPAELMRDQDSSGSATIRWQQDGLRFVVSTTLGPDFSLGDLMRILGSID